MAKLSSENKNNRRIKLSNKFYKKSNEFNDRDLNKFIDENEDQLKIEYLNFRYAKINPKNLIGVDEFNQAFFDQIDKIENIEFDEKDKSTVDQICDVLNAKVKPAVAKDGGDIDFKKFKDGVVYLNLQGSCAGCPSSSITLKNGIENLLKHYVRDVVGVEQYNV